MQPNNAKYSKLGSQTIWNNSRGLKMLLDNGMVKKNYPTIPLKTTTKSALDE
jgi:hypothetical protein